MKDYGFLRMAAAVPVVKLADPTANLERIEAIIEEAIAKQVSLITFPELCITGYTCSDLFAQSRLIDSAESAVESLKHFSKGKAITIVVGTPVRCRGRLYNCAAVIRNGTIRGIVPKIYMPTYGEFYEARWFSSGSDFLSPNDHSGITKLVDNGKSCFVDEFGATIDFAGSKATISPNLIFSIGKANFAIEICEDLWTPIPPSSWLALAGADIVLNLSASNDILMKNDYRKTLVKQQSARAICSYVYCSCGYGESTQDMVFAGSSFIYENGRLMTENERFAMTASLLVADLDIDRTRVMRQKESTFNSYSPDGTRAGEYHSHFAHIPAGECTSTDFEKQLYRDINPHPFVPSEGSHLNERCHEITDIQVMGLATRLAKIGCKSAVIGISGGLDSTLALLVTVLAFDKLGWDRKRIIGITMPGFGTTNRTHDNATELMRMLGVTAREISIVKAVRQHFEDIGQDEGVTDVTYENSQARERTQILMDVANKEGGIVVGTGDLSELALGWATYNGDHMSMYAVNASIPKTLVRSLVAWSANNRFAECKALLDDIIDTPISPELTPADKDGNIKQKTEDLVGPYELHDFFLYNMFRFGYAPEKILFLACKAFEGKYDREFIGKWLRVFIRRFFAQQFKRSCLPDCPKVGSVSLSPRSDWRMPSDAWSDEFLRGL